MFSVLIKWFVLALLVVFVSWLVPGIHVDNILSAMFVCLLMALINTFIKPFLLLITLPVNILSLGLFTLVINASLLMLAGFIAPGFEVEGFFSAVLGSILLSILSVGVAKI